MLKLISTTLVLCALAAGAAGTPTQDAAASQQQTDRQAQEQAERERKQAEREQKRRDKDAKKEPGSRCARWKSGKA